ncbi:MAG: alpha/beta hydrolase [Sulfuricaulis sp.]
MILNILLLSLVATIFAVVVSIHVGFHVPRRKEQGRPKDYGIDYEEIHIRTAGGKRLFAWWLPNETAAPTIIMLHGWGSNAELMLPLALPFHRVGLNVLLLDARNHGRSDSSFFMSLPRFAEDVEHAMDWVKTRGVASSRHIILLGHSVGAGAVLYVASSRRDVSAVISIAAFAHPEWMMRRHLARLHLPGWLTAVILRYVEWVIGHRYEEIAPLNTLCRAACPVLLVHGARDQTVPVSDAIALAGHCQGAAVELLIVEDAGHDSVESIETQSVHLISFLRKHGIRAA